MQVQMGLRKAVCSIRSPRQTQSCHSKESARNLPREGESV